jgi:YVTN family beta-propeller protein
VSHLGHFFFVYVDIVVGILFCNFGLGIQLTRSPHSIHDSRDSKAICQNKRRVEVIDYIKTMAKYELDNMDFVLRFQQSGNCPNFVSVNPSTNMVYVANYYDNTISVLDGKTNRVTITIPVDPHPSAISVNLSTNIIYVSSRAHKLISVINGTTNTMIFWKLCWSN